MAKILLMVTGSIAAYKSVSLMRKLQYEGHKLTVMQTSMAKEFVGPTTFRSFGDYVDEKSAYPHLDTSRECDLIIVAPATANIIAKMAHGIADELVSTTLLGFDGPKIVAPAMNFRMLNSAATQRNLIQLELDGVKIVSPGEGLLACGDEGQGKLADIEKIMMAVRNVLDSASN